MSLRGGYRRSNLVAHALPPMYATRLPRCARNDMVDDIKTVFIMRIIAELPHPEFKISILNMNDKFIVKIEQGSLEQTYKLAGIDLRGTALPQSA